MATNDIQNKIDSAMRAFHAAQVKQAVNSPPLMSSLMMTAGSAQTNVAYSGDFNIRVTECENGYIISATRGPKAIVRVASSDDLHDQIAACMASLKLD